MRTEDLTRGLWIARVIVGEDAIQIVPGSPDNEGSNIERTDVFEIFFPDCTEEALQGGAEEYYRVSGTEAQWYRYTLEMRCH
jgi:hypothetical protein